MGHFGHIDLAEIVFNIGYFAFVQKILSCICPLCAKLLIYKNEDEIKEMLRTKTGKERMSYIKSLSKNVTYCQHPNGGCGAQIPKIKEKKSAGSRQIIAETEVESKIEGEGKNKLKQVLTPDIIYHILKNISDDDCRILGMDPSRSRPEDMIHKTFPVPPIQMRPSAKGDFGGGSAEDDLTHKLADIVKSNLRINKNKESQNESNNTYHHDHANLLQYHVFTYIDNDSMTLKSEQKGKPFKSLSSRLKGKTGRVRGNLMGKRGDFTARTVITSDPTIDNNQLGVPVKIAMNLTFPEVVTPYNIDYMTKLVANGRDNYPGANFVFLTSRVALGKRVFPIDLRYRKEVVELHYGDVVERHLIDGDIVLLNRQPTLHKQSMMGHRIKVINNPELMTFRLSVAITTPYNADFDGDEMNIFVPQTLQTQIELEELACVEKQLISPTSSKTVLGIVQDGLLGAYNLTSPTVRIDWRTAMNIMSYTSLEDFSAIKKGKEYNGSELYSLIIPPSINVSKATLKIKNGKIVEGRLSKDALGAKKKNTLVQLIWDGYGVNETRKFIDNTQRLVNNFNLWNGFSCGIGDLSMPAQVYDEIDKLFETKELKIDHFITEMENNPQSMPKEIYELKLFSELNVIRSDVSKLIMANYDKNNAFNVMALSGSKGDESNTAQMIGCVGFQAFEGGLIPKKYNNRTLCYFHQNDDRSASRGLVRRSFVQGMEYPEYVFHTMASRLGTIDQAIKTALTGYAQRKLVKLMEDNMIAYDNTVRSANGKLMQIVYGDSGADTTKQYEYIIRMLEMSNKDLQDKFQFSSNELKNYDFSDKNNNKMMEEIFYLRNTVRENIRRAKMNYIIQTTAFMLPVNITRIVDTVSSDVKLSNTKTKDEDKFNPDYILDQIEALLDNNKTNMMCMTDAEKSNKMSFKYRDEQIHKLILKTSLYDSLAPKRVLVDYKLNKTQFDTIVNEISVNFNKNMIEPGEMAGVIAAQSVGEPLTQMTLNSIDWEDKIIIKSELNNEMKIVKIGKFIDDFVNKNKKLVKNLGNNIEEEKGDIKYLDIKEHNYSIQSVNKDGKVSWSKIDAVTKHLPKNKDGTNTLLKIKTRLGKEVTVTKGLSCLARINNEIVAIRGDELKVGSYLPTVKNFGKIKYNDYYNLEEHFPKTEYIYGSEIKSVSNGDIKQQYKTGYIYSNIYSKMSTNTVSEIPEKIKLDESFGFYIGAYIAEGCCNDSYICIMSNNDSYREKIRTFAQKYNIVYHESNKAKYEIQLHSRLFAKMTGELCGIFAHNRKIPEFVFNANDDFVSGLLDGYFSGDGTISKKDLMSVLSVSKKLLIGLSTLLTRYGIVSKVVKNDKNIENVYTLSIRNKNIKLVMNEKNSNNIFSDDKVPGINMESMIHLEKTYNKRSSTYEDYKNGIVHMTKIKKLYNNCNISKHDKTILKKIINSDVHYDQIVEITEVEPTHTYVYDLTVEKDYTFATLSGILCMDSFHSAGIAKISGTQGVPRINELLSVSKKPKTPQMIIYLTNEYLANKNMAHKIASHIKHTTLGDIRNKIDVYYDPEPNKEGGIMEKDNVKHTFFNQKGSKVGCQSDINGCPWLLRIELNREKLLEKEVTLLEIKSKFCSWWEKRFADPKSMKKEERKILNKIVQIAVLSNTDNDVQPVLHIRFNVRDVDKEKDRFDSTTINGFIEFIVDKFKLKGISGITDINDTSEEKTIVYNKETGAVERNSEYVIYAAGTNLKDIRYLIGIDLVKTISDDVAQVYETFGIEIARAVLLREIVKAFEIAGSDVNYQHLTMIVDQMTCTGTINSVDRHGMNKGDNDPLSRASFEKTVEQLLIASVYGETDNMNSVSSRIMAGLVIKGGTGFCELELDTNMIENSEYVENLDFRAKHTELNKETMAKDILDKDNDEIFMPV